MSKLLCKAQIGSHAHREDNSITGYGHLAAVRLLEDTARWGDFQQLMLCKLAHASEAAFHIDDVLEMLSGSDLWQEIVDRDMVALAGQLLSGFQASHAGADHNDSLSGQNHLFRENIRGGIHVFSINAGDGAWDQGRCSGGHKDGVRF